MRADSWELCLGGGLFIRRNSVTGALEWHLPQWDKPQQINKSAIYLLLAQLMQEHAEELFERVAE